MFQQITLVGFLGRDPEMRFTPKGDAVTDFSIAASRRKDETVWFKVSVWGSQAEACNQYLKKGSKALVIGRLVAGDDGNPKTFQRKDGTTGSSFEVSADKVRFLDSKEETEIRF